MSDKVSHRQVSLLKKQPEFSRCKNLEMSADAIFDAQYRNLIIKYTQYKIAQSPSSGVDLITDLLCLYDLKVI